MSSLFRDNLFSNFAVTFYESGTLTESMAKGSVFSVSADCGIIRQVYIRKIPFTPLSRQSRTTFCLKESENIYLYYGSHEIIAGLGYLAHCQGLALSS